MATEPQPRTRTILVMSPNIRVLLIVAGFICFLISAIDPGLAGGSWESWLSGGFAAWTLEAYP